MEHNFLVQVLDRPTSGEVLDQVLTNMEEIIKEFKIRGSVGCSDHALTEFMISNITGLAKNGVRTLTFRRVKFMLLKELLDNISSETVLRDKEVKQSWLIFKDAFLSVRALCSSE